ncbi:unnamed protein product, partial [Eruca vesicaria subsp. sativa]|nr:unnamed protein product [Eruca vesicaria subsp. sativa]
MASASGSALCFTDASSPRVIRCEVGVFCLAPRTVNWFEASSMRCCGCGGNELIRLHEDAENTKNQDSDPDSTIIEVTCGGRLGALLDIMNALMNLGLNVVKVNVYLDSSGKHNKICHYQ